MGSGSLGLPTAGDVGIRAEQQWKKLIYSSFGSDGLRILLMIFVAVCLFNAPAEADRLKFAKFVQNQSNLPGSYKRLRNSFDGLSAKRVHRFSIEGGECQSRAYGDGSGKGDCTFGSVRSMLREVHRNGRWDFAQPKEAWYGWDMLIPSDYPTRGNQTRGSFIFAQWKGFVCPHAAIAHSTDRTEPNHLYLRLQTVRGNPGNFDCRDVARIPLIRMGAFKGGWRNFQVYARWSHGPDGRVVVFVDGRQLADYRGPTLNQDPNGSHPKARTNHFSFGSYLCCTGGVHLVQPGTLYFANVKRAGSREALGQ